jgi:hypothetical protein
MLWLARSVARWRGVLMAVPTYYGWSTTTTTNATVSKNSVLLQDAAMIARSVRVTCSSLRSGWNRSGHPSHSSRTRRLGTAVMPGVGLLFSLLSVPFVSGDATLWNSVLRLSCPIEPEGTSHNAAEKSSVGNWVGHTYDPTQFQESFEIPNAFNKHPWSEAIACGAMFNATGTSDCAQLSGRVRPLPSIVCGVINIAPALYVLALQCALQCVLRIVVSRLSVKSTYCRFVCRFDRHMAACNWLHAATA